MYINPILKHYIRDGLETYVVDHDNNILKACKSYDDHTYFTTVYGNEAEYIKKLDYYLTNYGHELRKARLEAIRDTGFEPYWVGAHGETLCF